MDVLHPVCPWGWLDLSIVKCWTVGNMHLHVNHIALPIILIFCHLSYHPASNCANFRLACQIWFTLIWIFMSHNCKNMSSFNAKSNLDERIFTFHCPKFIPFTVGIVSNCANFRLTRQIWFTLIWIFMSLIYKIWAHSTLNHIWTKEYLHFIGQRLYLLLFALPRTVPILDLLAKSDSV